MFPLAAIEWNWGEAILNESARDVFAIVGVIGFAVTVLGFIVTIWQLVKTRSAANAAETAAKETLAKSRFEFERLVSNRALRFLHESKIHVDADRADKAEIRLNDLAHELNQLASLDFRWKQLADELHEWYVMCNRLAAGKRKQFPKKDKWLDFCRRLEGELSAVIGPFSGTKGTST